MRLMAGYLEFACLVLSALIGMGAVVAFLVVGPDLIRGLLAHVSGRFLALLMGVPITVLWAAAILKVALNGWPPGMPLKDKVRATAGFIILGLVGALVLVYAFRPSGERF